MIYEKRLGQGKPNWIYVLKPELNGSQKCQNGISKDANKTILEVPKRHPNDTYVKDPNLKNVNRTRNGEVVENFKGGMKEYPGPKKYRFKEKEQLAKEIAEELNDNHSLGAFRTIAYKISEQKIRIFLSIIKDTYLTGRIKKSIGAMFISLAKAYAVKNGINLNFK